MITVLLALCEIFFVATTFLFMDFHQLLIFDVFCFRICGNRYNCAAAVLAQFLEERDNVKTNLL